MIEAAHRSELPVFAERLTQPVVREGLVLGAALIVLALIARSAVGDAGGTGILALALFVGFFFRNPARALAGDERTVVAPADGRVIAAGEMELPDGAKATRIGIFLSIFDVHVNRIPVAGRVVALARGGARYRAAFDRRAECENVRCTLTLETDRGERVQVIQLAGLVARRIVCQPDIGQWVRRGDRYGMIRFGSRTDVVLPVGAQLLVAEGDRVRGGSSAVARLPEEA